MNIGDVIKLLNSLSEALTEEQHEYCRYIRGAGKKLNFMLTNSVDFARME